MLRLVCLSYNLPIAWVAVTSLFINLCYRIWHQHTNWSKTTTVSESKCWSNRKSNNNSSNNNNSNSDLHNNTGHNATNLPPKRTPNRVYVLVSHLLSAVYHRHYNNNNHHPLVQVMEMKYSHNLLLCARHCWGMSKLYFKCFKIKCSIKLPAERVSLRMQYTQ